MASHAPCHYDKTCEFYWVVSRLIYYFTPVKANRYFNWDNVPREIFNFTTAKVDAYFKYIAHMHPDIMTRLVNDIRIVCQ